ncbi:MAG: sugar nucleotide-binding protein [Planctomycetes bacterium]|nr:sugar nucleotide-binding protein [Planctomycetota bacterium]
MRDDGAILVTGAAGFLGHAVARELVARGRRVVGTSRDGQGLPEGVEPAPLSLDDGGQAAGDLVRALRPAAVVHLAAMADADACARAPEAARRVNVDAAGQVAAAASAAGARTLYTSSDLVFGGDRAPYAEDDPPAPLGPYMATKADGEAAVLAADPGALVARVALLYGRRRGRRGCFTDVLVERLRRGEQVPLFVDQHRTPLLVDDAAALLCDLLERRAAGRVHVAGPERASRHAHGLALARALGLDPAGCVAARMADVPGLSPRPADASLRIDRLVGLVGRAPLGLAEGCARLAAEADLAGR